MTNEQLTLFGILLTALVTIIGWIYTASVQNTILQETQKAQNLSREIMVFRERLLTIKAITASLVSQSASYEEFATLIRSGQLKPDQIADMLNRRVKENFDITKHFVDPTYRSICSQLPDTSFQKLGQQLEKLLRSIEQLNVYKREFSLSTFNLDQWVNMLADQAKIISTEMMDTASIFADLFADLDKSISGIKPT